MLVLLVSLWYKVAERASCVLVLLVSLWYKVAERASCVLVLLVSLWYKAAERALCVLVLLECWLASGIRWQREPSVCVLKTAG